MKNKVLLWCGLLVLILFIVLGTFLWYQYFLKLSGNYSIVQSNNRVTSGDIVLEDEGINVVDSDATNIDDDEVGTVTPYKFQIINKGSNKSEYTLYLEDLPINSINDGCTMDTLLTRSQLKYQLRLNNKVIKEDYLENIKDNGYLLINTSRDKNSLLNSLPNNIKNIIRIVGEDTENKIYKLLDFSDNPRDIADPYYTGNFEITYNDILEGCKGLLEKIGSELDDRK